MTSMIAILENKRAILVLFAAVFAVAGKIDEGRDPITQHASRTFYDLRTSLCPSQ